MILALSMIAVFAAAITFAYFTDQSDEVTNTFTMGNVQITLDNVFIVWFCKTLQNWKALVSTTLPDGMYYEVTYNGDKKEAYLDAYKKFENRCIKES